MKINFLQNIYAPSILTEIGIREYFDMVRGAKFEQQILTFRKSRLTGESKDVIERYKTLIPAVSVSGIFNAPLSCKNLKEHSGLICVDFDRKDNADADFNKIKKNLSADKYSHSLSFSVSGDGLSCIVKIDPEKHAESFGGLQEYYFKNYTLIIDKSCRDVSRRRFVSMDSDLFINERASTFRDYIKISARPPKISSAVLTKTQFDEVIEKICRGNYDLTNGEYNKYLTIGFALSSEFSEQGRDYFHQICAQHSKYTQAHCDKQYNYCMRDTGKKKIRIGSFYHLVKEAGIELKDRAGSKLETIAKMAKKDGRTQMSVVRIAQQIGLDPVAAKDIAEQVFTKNVSLEITGESDVAIVSTFLTSNYNLRYNIITQDVEDRNVKINDRYEVIGDMELNTMYMRFCECTDEKISKDFFYTFIFSKYTEAYNPFLDFIELNKNINRSEQLIADLANTIETDTPDVEKFLRHWGCGIIASIYGQHSPLVWVMAGELIGTGKTEWFRRLLPPALLSYYTESKLDGGKDDDILMCKKLIIMDDEFSGKSKFEAKKFKELTSKQVFSIRPPYGRVAKDFNRIAVLCATTNDLNILNDPTGNRRIIAINVIDVKKEEYNAIDKSALFMAFHDLYKSGFKWQLSREDVAVLNTGADRFQATNFEAELIEQYFEIPGINQVGEWVTNTAIKTHIEIISKQKIFNTNKLGSELKNMGFQQKRTGLGRFYYVKKK